MRANYTACLAITAKWEGHISNHPNDPGGLTNRGVTQAVYDAFRKAHGHTTRTVTLLTEVEYQDIYRDNYWNAVKGDQLPMGLDGLTFDGGVNSGPSRGIKWLQRAVGTTVDGKIGPQTIAAANAAYSDGQISAINACKRAIAARTSFLHGLSTFATFGRGWMNRVADWEVKSVLMAQAAFHGTAGGAPDPVVLRRERDEAAEDARTAGKRVGGSATAGGTGSAASGASTASADPVAGLSDGALWGIAAVILLAGLFGVYLWWRKRRLHQARELAYASAVVAAKP